MRHHDNPGKDTTSQLTSDNGTNFSYDLNGNRTNSGSVTGPNNQLLSDGTWNYRYDAEGNLIQKVNIADGTTWTYGYDERNQMIAAEQRDGSGHLVQHIDDQYDVFGNRTAESVFTAATGLTVTTQFAYDGPNAWADLDANGSLITRRIFGDGMDQPLARITASTGNIAWYLTDRLGSVRQMTDNLGVVQYQATYGAFDDLQTEVGASFGDRYKFVSREYDAATGLYYYRARYYDPSTGRFTGEDPAGFAAGDTNLNRYVRNDPTNLRDPSGLVAEADYGGSLWNPDDRPPCNGIGEPILPTPGAELPNIPVPSLPDAKLDIPVADMGVVPGNDGVVPPPPQGVFLPEPAPWENGGSWWDWTWGHTKGIAEGFWSGAQGFTSHLFTAAGDWIVHEILEYQQSNFWSWLWKKSAWDYNPAWLPTRIGWSVLKSTALNLWYLPENLRNIGRAWEWNPDWVMGQGLWEGLKAAGTFVLAKNLTGGGAKGAAAGEEAAAAPKPVTPNSAAARTAKQQALLDIEEEAIRSGQPVPGIHEPGPYAGEGIPTTSGASAKSPNITAQNNANGQANGCHICGAKSPGSPNGNWIKDHIPPTHLTRPGDPQMIHPSCQACSNRQGWIVRNLRALRDWLDIFGD